MEPGTRGDGPVGGPRATRRSVLAGACGLGVAALAGCLGGPRASTGSGGIGGDEGARSIEDHPAGADLGAQPTLGPDPYEAEAVIVDFSDPSCPTCRRFEGDVVPRIETELVEPGRASFVFRGYPIVYPWGEPATQALESTFARDEGAFWALKDFYYAEQPSFDESNVLERTRGFLAENTDLDSDAVVGDAEARAHGAAVQTDLDAGKAAGAGRTTPHLFLFRDGEFVTKAAGSVSYSVIANALEL